MADRYLIETSATDGYLLEDGSGVLLMEEFTLRDIELITAAVAPPTRREN